MKVRGIDRLVVALEKRADEIGVEIDSMEIYITICSTITAMDFGEVVSFEQKQWVYNSLRELYVQVGLDFDWAVRELVLSAWGS